MREAVPVAVVVVGRRRVDRIPINDWAKATTEPRAGWEPSKSPGLDVRRVSSVNALIHAGKPLPAVGGVHWVRT